MGTFGRRHVYLLFCKTDHSPLLDWIGASNVIELAEINRVRPATHFVPPVHLALAERPSRGNYVLDSRLRCSRPDQCLDRLETKQKCWKTR